MSDTTKYRLSDVIDIIGGGTPKRKVDDYWGGDIPWLSVVDFNSGARFVNDTVEKVTKLGLEKSSTKLLKAGQIIISARGTVGCLAQLSRPMAFNQSCYGLSGKGEIIVNDFLYYLMRSKVEEIKRKTHGAVFDTITKETFNHIEVDIPSITIQIEIAKILGDLDKKIELNRQTNQTLEQIAQAIFKSWFVDFEPVKAKIAAKQNGQNPELAAMCAISGKTEEQIKDLDEAAQQQLKTTAALFPDALVESELGEIPEGWEIKPLSQMIELIGGGTPKRSEESYWGGSIPWFSVKDAPADGDVFAINTDEKITGKGLIKSSTKLLPEGVTIISARGTVGRLAMVGVPMAMNQSCYGVKAGTGLGAAFNYFNLKNATSTLQQQTHGAVFDTITTNTFNSVYAVKPCVNSAVEFERLVAPLLIRIKRNLFEILSLADCRDSLLPKLLSGEITLGVTHSAAEAVA